MAATHEAGSGAGHLDGPLSLGAGVEEGVEVGVVAQVAIAHQREHLDAVSRIVGQFVSLGQAEERMSSLLAYSRTSLSARVLRRDPPCSPAIS